jgi:hypothetical protein
MKKILLLLACSAALLLQTAQAQKTEPVNKTLKKVLELAIPDADGSNGASVVWHPVLKRYYAAMAGNALFFIGAYDMKGKLLTPEDLEAQFDIRGMWYNPASKTIQMNGYDAYGWAEYKLDTKGVPVSVKNIIEQSIQPDAQSTGAYDPVAKQLYFFNQDGNIDKYDFKTTKFSETLELTLGYTAKEAEDDADEIDNEIAIADYNTTTVIYTGIKNAEIGLLNVLNSEVELYDLKTGHITQKLSLPEDAPVEEALNFAYTNGVLWLFDKNTRSWKGYK